MSEKKPFDKRWLVVVAILVLLAIIAVTIVLCLPGNPKSAIQALQKDSSNNLFADSNVEKSYDNFEEKIKTSVSKYSAEMKDVQLFIESVSIVVDQYNEFAFHFKENENFYDNYKPVTSNLNEIQNIKQTIKNELTNVEENLDKDSKDFLRQAWINTRVLISQMTQKYSTAFDSLNKLFKGSYFGVEQNLASQTFFNVVNDYLTVIQEKFENLCKNDTVSTALEEYDYNFSAIITSFNNFVSNLEGIEDGFEYDFLNYYYKESVKSNYEKINAFYNLYKQTDLGEVISSAKTENNGITFTKTFENVEDSNGVYTALKTYLGGN